MLLHGPVFMEFVAILCTVNNTPWKCYHWTPENSFNYTSLQSHFKSACTLVLVSFYTSWTSELSVYHSHMKLDPSQPISVRMPIHWVPMALSPEVKQPGCEIDHSYLVPRVSIWEVITSPYIFLAWHLIKQIRNISFTFLHSVYSLLVVDSKVPVSVLINTVLILNIYHACLMDNYLTWQA